MDKTGDVNQRQKPPIKHWTDRYLEQRNVDYRMLQKPHTSMRSLNMVVQNFILEDLVWGLAKQRYKIIKLVILFFLRKTPAYLRFIQYTPNRELRSSTSEAISPVTALHTRKLEKVHGTSLAQGCGTQCLIIFEI